MKLTQTNYVDEAEKVVKNLKRNRRGEIALTTSKLRNILTMISSIYNDVIHLNGEQLDHDLLERLQYLKMRIAYEAGRDKDKDQPIRDLVEKAKIRENIDAAGNSKKECVIFCRYMESIVAYHKFYGGKD